MIRPLVLLPFLAFLQAAVCPAVQAQRPSASDQPDPTARILSQFKPPYSDDVAKSPFPRQEWDELLSSPDRFFSVNRFVPYQGPEGERGYQIERIGDPVLRRLGLQEGDVVLGVNGMGLGSLDRAYAAVGILQRATLLKLVVERSGRIFDLNYQFTDPQ